MDYSDDSADIEALARIASQLAGRNPDERVRMVLAEIVVFDDVMWRYPDFLNRAAAAYAILMGAPPKEARRAKVCFREETLQKGVAANPSQPANPMVHGKLGMADTTC